ncbi:hypothetical protein KCP75_19425 [Salmonella enterica subsp. enterica]|nr:hypothetical protein KCP75_19425 [Salmonella enterica subsp. enterica]
MASGRWASPDKCITTLLDISRQRGSATSDFLYGIDGRCSEGAHGWKTGAAVACDNRQS